MHQGRYDQAMELLRNPLALTVACLGLARHAARAGDTDTAQARGRQGRAAAVGAGYQVGVIDALEASAVLSDQAVLLAAVDAERIRSGYARFPIDEPAYRAAVAAVGDVPDSEPISVEEAVALAMGDESAAPRPASSWASLTPTELRVAELVADALTNPEVGEKLFISRRTVQAHLSHIYAKLDVANRAELATAVARRRDSS